MQPIKGKKLAYAYLPKKSFLTHRVKKTEGRYINCDLTCANNRYRHRYGRGVRNRRGLTGCGPRLTPTPLRALREPGGGREAALLPPVQLDLFGSSASRRTVRTEMKWRLISLCHSKQKAHAFQ